MNPLQNYNKQQSEMIIFLALVGLIFVIISHVMFIKPSFATASKCKAQMIKVEENIALEDIDAVKLRELSAEQRKLTRHTRELEKNLLHGLRYSRLIPFFTDIVSRYDFPVKPSYGYERNTEVPVENFLEVYSKISIDSYDFMKLGSFINALESSNSGLRISNLTLSKEDPEIDNGRVKVEFELRLLGYKEESEQPEKWDPDPRVAFDVGEARNPFSRPGVQKTVTVKENFAETLKNIIVTSKWKGLGLLIKRGPYGKETEWMLGEEITIGGKRVKLIKFSIDLPNDYLIIGRNDNNTLYRLSTRSRTIKEIKELNQ